MKGQAIGHVKEEEIVDRLYEEIMKFEPEN
jgi:hypothetical protein